MGQNVNKVITRSAWTVIVVFVLRCLIGQFDFLSFLKCESWYDYFGAAGEAISFTTVILILYDKLLWKINPFDSTPKLSGEYTGTIEYTSNNQKKKKSTKVIITQTSLKVMVKITTNEITSNTIASNLVEENGEFVLYYTYITNPRSRYSDENPIQHGTCRLIKTGANTLEGQYWTSRKTIGDIKLTRS